MGKKSKTPKAEATGEQRVKKANGGGKKGKGAVN